MPERDPLAELFRRLEQPVSPPAPFAATLRRRLLTELDDGTTTKEREMSGAGLTIDQPRVVALPLPGPLAASDRAGSRWRLAVHLIAAAGLVVTLTGGAFLGSRLLPGLLSPRQGPEEAATTSVPMLGVDPGRTGANPGPAPVGAPELLWRAFAGVGAKTPAIVDGVAYVAGDTGFVVAFDAVSGTELWRVGSGGGADIPTVVDGVVYIGQVSDSETLDSAGALLALDAGTGSQLWQASTGSFGGASPVVVNGVAYAGGDQELYAFDAATGERLWLYELDAEPCVCTPRPVAVAEGIVYVVPGGQQQASLFAVDAATGAELWRYDGTMAGDDARFTDPVTAGGLVFVGEGELFGTASAGRFVALDATTGEEAWTRDLDASAAPAVGDGILYVQARSPGELPGTLNALDAETGADVWAVSTVEASLAAPAVAGDLLLVPAGLRGGYADGFDDDLLVAFDAATGAERWRTGLRGSISGPPAITGGAIYVTTYHEGILFALGDDGQGLGGPATPGTEIDLSGREPCLAEPTSKPYAGDLVGTPAAKIISPSQIGPSGQIGAELIVAEIPVGEAASEEVAAAANATLRDYAACIGEEPAHLYGFFSDGYFQRAAETMEELGIIPGAEFAVTLLLPPFSPFADLTLREVRELPDGRIGGIFDGGYSPIFAIFVERDGRWLIDELGTIVDPSYQPRPPTTPLP
ncbi:MAG: PQQ-binding-like beta-propeller repeat protein [Chloroflexota bacterium]|nr:PQQ-binding-like beta-propeller repeat protein [Chloroflexota bacterium]